MSKLYIEVRAVPFRGAEEVEKDGKRYYIKTTLPLNDAAVRGTLDAYVEGESKGLEIHKIRSRSW